MMNCDLSPADIAARGRMFVEWRVSDPALSKTFAALQKHLLATGGDLVMAPQSCAPDNMHVTLNEFVVRTAKEVARAVAAVEQWARQHLGSCLRDTTHAMLPDALGVFNKRVVYVKVQDGDTLARIFTSCHAALTAAGFKQVGKGPQHFTPHITVCKAGRKMKKALPKETEPFWTAVAAHSKLFGHAPLGELVLCCKRAPTEARPPVICRVRAGPTAAKAEASHTHTAAAAAAAEASHTHTTAVAKAEASHTHTAAAAAAAGSTDSEKTVGGADGVADSGE